VRQAGAFSSVVELHERWLAWSKDRFGVLLILLTANYAVLMTLPSENGAFLIGAAVVAVTVLFALDVAVAHRRVRITARILVPLLFVMPFANVLGVATFRAPIPISLGLILILATGVILLRIVGHERVNLGTLFAAIDVYILLGLVFAELFIGFSRFGFASPFLAQKMPLGHPANESDFVYMSYVVLTTLGFGDLTPYSKVARTLVVTEALIGQIFLVTAVARVVSVFGLRRESLSAGSPRGIGQSES